MHASTLYCPNLGRCQLTAEASPDDRDTVLQFLSEMIKLTTFATTSSNPVRESGHCIKSIVEVCYSLLIDTQSPCPVKAVFATADALVDCVQLTLQSASAFFDAREKNYTDLTVELINALITHTKDAPEPKSTSPVELKTYIAAIAPTEKILVDLAKQAEQLDASVTQDADSIPCDISRLNPKMDEPSLC
jgi:hypothetical protein